MLTKCFTRWEVRCAEMMETADDADIVPGADRATLRREKAARRAEEGEVAMAEYRAAEEATHKKTARLRAARLARDASLANPPATEAPKNRRLIGSMRRHEAVKEAPRTIVTRAKRSVR